jgi:hypothetical protein
VSRRAGPHRGDGEAGAGVCALLPCATRCVGAPENIPHSSRPSYLPPPQPPPPPPPRAHPTPPSAAAAAAAAAEAAPAETPDAAVAAFAEADLRAAAVPENETTSERPAVGRPQIGVEGGWLGPAAGARPGRRRRAPSRCSSVLSPVRPRRPSRRPRALLNTQTPYALASPPPRCSRACGPHSPQPSR